MNDGPARPSGSPASRAGSKPQGGWQPPTVEKMQAMLQQCQISR